MEHKVKVVINNAQYTLVSSDPEEYIEEMAANVDRQMKELTDSSSHVSPLMAAVLTAVNYCDMAQKLENDAANLRVQLKNYIDDANKLRTQCADANKEASRLLNEVQNLKVQLAKEQQKL